MRGALVVAVVVLATALAWGQRGVAAARGGFAPHGSYGFYTNPGSVHINTGFPHTHFGGYSPYLYGYVNPPFRSGFGVSFGYPYYGFPYYARFNGGYPYRHRGYGYGYYGSGYGYPYGGYGGYGYPFWGGNSYSSESTTSYDQSGQTQQLTNQVNQLSYEVQRLREEQEIARSSPPQPGPPPPQAAGPAPTASANGRGKPPVKATTMTKLVFADGHSEEVADYAIVGQTLWIINEQRAVKVPLTRIDVPATQRANEDRGLDFVVPR